MSLQLEPVMERIFGDDIFMGEIFGKDILLRPSNLPGQYGNGDSDNRLSTTTTYRSSETKLRRTYWIMLLATEK